MECPLCESKKFKQCGTIANGDFKYQFSNLISRFYRLVDEQDLTDKPNQILKESSEKVNRDRLVFSVTNTIFSEIRNKFL
ncbi:MAG: hypothetical protein ACK53E_12100 [Pseudanabaena sp.]